MSVSLSVFSSSASYKLFVMSGRLTKRGTSFPVSSGFYLPATIRRRYESRFSFYCFFFFISLSMCPAVFLSLLFSLLCTAHFAFALRRVPKQHEILLGLEIVISSLSLPAFKQYNHNNNNNNSPPLTYCVQCHTF